MLEGAVEGACATFVALGPDNSNTDRDRTNQDILHHLDHSRGFDGNIITKNGGSGIDVSGRVDTSSEPGTGDLGADTDGFGDVREGDDARDGEDRDYGDGQVGFIACTEGGGES